jgi:MFS family permease
MARSLKRRWPRGGLWGHRDFLKLWSGQTISEFGSQVSLLALPLIAISVLHAGAFAVAALSMVEQVPFLLFALPAGVWVDRLARRPILIAGDVGRALTLASIPIAQAAGVLTLGQLYAVGFVTGVLTVFFDVAYQAYLPSLVERGQLVEGNSKLQVSASAAQIAGPGIAAVLIRAFTAPYAVLGDAASFVSSSAFVLGIRTREHVEGRRAATAVAGMKAELFEGVRYVVRNRYLRAIAMCTAISNFFANVGWVILILYFVRRLDLSVLLIGIIFSCANLGFLVGALIAGWLNLRLGVGRAILLSAVLVGPSMLLIAASPMSFPVPLVVFALMVFGFSGVLYNITQISLRQAITPEHLQGRMNSVMRFVVWGVLPLGALLGGALAATIGLRATLVVSGVGAMLSWVPIALSPVSRLRTVPDTSDAAEGAAETGLLGGFAASVDTELATTARPGGADA